MPTLKTTSKNSAGIMKTENKMEMKKETRKRVKKDISESKNVSSNVSDFVPEQNENSTIKKKLRNLKINSSVTGKQEKPKRVRKNVEKSNNEKLLTTTIEEKPVEVSQNVTIENLSRAKRALKKEKRENSESIRKKTFELFDKDNLPIDISRRCYRIDRKGRAYRSYRLESFDGIKPQIEHSATQNTKYPITSDKYKNRGKGYTFGLGPRNAASKILTSFCSFDNKMASINKDYKPIDVVNKNHVMVIKETTRGSNQDEFIYSVFRLPNNNISYKVEFHDPATKEINVKSINPKFTNKLYSMKSVDDQHVITPQIYAKRNLDKSNEMTDNQ